MTDPLNSFYTDFGRFYAHPSARQTAPVGGFSVIGDLITQNADPLDPFAPKPSVTNIIGMMHKPFLAPHYAKLVATYAVENLDQLRYQVDKFGPQVAAGSLKAVPDQPHPNAAIGDEIHAAIDAHSKDSEHVPEFSTTTAAAMYAQWLHFVATSDYRVVKSEFTVWSYKHGYAGTGDVMLEDLQKRLWLVDNKSGKGIYPEVALQTTSLAHADVILDGLGNESPMPDTQVQGVIHIRPRSIKLHRLEKTDEAWETFLACKRIFDWKRFDADLVIQDPIVSQFVKGAK